MSSIGTMRDMKASNIRFAEPVRPEDHPGDRHHQDHDYAKDMRSRNSRRKSCG